MPVLQDLLNKSGTSQYRMAVLVDCDRALIGHYSDGGVSFVGPCTHDKVKRIGEHLLLRGVPLVDICEWQVSVNFIPPLIQDLIAWGDGELDWENGDAVLLDAIRDLAVADDDTKEKVRNFCTYVLGGTQP